MPGMEDYFRVYAHTPEELAEVLYGADLAFLYLRIGAPVEEHIEAAVRLVHRRGNIIVAGRFSAVWKAFPHLSRFAVQSLVIETPPRIDSPYLPASAHRIALVAWRDPAHIQHVRARYWGGRVVGDTDVIPASTSILKRGQARRIRFTLHALGRGWGVIPLDAFAVLVERYTDPGGLVVDLGPPSGPLALVAWTLGRRAVALVGSEGEAEEFREAVKGLARPLKRRRRQKDPDARDEAPRAQAPEPPRE